jgi:class 3 adenylate cyclase
VAPVLVAVGSSTRSRVQVGEVVRRSSELAAVLKRIVVAFESRDVATARSLISQADETLVLGTDAVEWWYGVEGYELFAAHVEVTPEFRWTIHRLDAYEEGSVGWAAADTTVAYANGMMAHPRITAVFHLEDGVWRVVQWHASVPQPTVEMAGVELPTSLGELLESLDDDLLSALRAKFRTTTVTLLFSDIEESTNRAMKFGDVVWGDVVQRHFAELHRIANAHDGIVVKTMGDGAMLAFESARDAAYSAVEIQRSVARQQEGGPFKVRVGVHTGDAMYTDGDYFGQTVDKTARVAAAAVGGQVLVTDVVFGLVGQVPGLAYGDPIALELKGIPGTHAAYPLSEA